MVLEGVCIRSSIVAWNAMPRDSSAFIVDPADRAALVVGGNDRASWLHGLLSNDIASLGAGQGCYSTCLTPQGRMIADLHVVNLGPLMLLDVPEVARTQLLERLEQFIITEDVEVEDVSGRVRLIGVYGTAAASVLARVLVSGGEADAVRLADSLSSLREDDAVMVGPLGGAKRARGFELEAADAILVANRDAGGPGFTVLVATSREAALRAALHERDAGNLALSDWDALRIEAGRPAFGIDMGADTIPLEAGLEDRAISFTKGCYVGQEVIVRVRDRGHGRVARRLVGLVSPPGIEPAGTVIAAGDTVRVEAGDVGRVTSAAHSTALAGVIALGYVHRDHADAGTPVVVVHEGREVPMTVATLPLLARHDAGAAS